MSTTVADQITVPKRYEEWAFEYKLGYDHGRSRKKYSWAPALGNTSYPERRRAYRAGRTEGAKAKAAAERAR